MILGRSTAELHVNLNQNSQTALLSHIKHPTSYEDYIKDK